MVSLGGGGAVEGPASEGASASIQANGRIQPSANFCLPSNGLAPRLASTVTAPLSASSAGQLDPRPPFYSIRLANRSRQRATVPSSGVAPRSATRMRYHCLGGTFSSPHSEQR